ncbi:MAG: hypothetical protein ACI37T_04135 [Candidatus Gastranaerophilaceae bacterium]
MNEINNNIPHIITNISSNSNKNAEQQPKVTNDSASRDIVPDTGVFGKSQVSKPDNIQSDIDFCLKQSPEFLEKYDKFFDNAFETLSLSNDDFAYEKACVLAKEFANEFS